MIDEKRKFAAIQMLLDAERRLSAIIAAVEDSNGDPTWKRKLEEAESVIVAMRAKVSNEQ